MNEIQLTEEERKVLHTLLMDLTNGQVSTLGINKLVYSQMGDKSIRLVNTGKWE